MAFFDFFKTRVAAPSKHKHIYQPNHILTHDFGVITPVFKKYMVPGDEFNVDLTQFTRLMPLPCPTFGVVKSINRGFFVPLDFVMTNFNEFVQGNYTASSNLNRPDLIRTPAVPFVTLSALLKSLASSSELVEDDTSAYDLQLNENGERYRYRFTWVSRKVWSFLCSLGLNLPRYCIVDGDASSYQINVLPILCFWKFYIDCVVPVRFRHNYLKYEAYFQAYTTDNANLSGQLPNLLSIPTAWLSPDYFNSAFENPFGVDYNRPSYDSISNPAFIGSLGNTMNGVSSTPISNSNVGAHIDTFGSYENANYVINAFTIQSLAVLQDMINRNRITDVKVREWLLATYGVAPNNDALHLATYLGSYDSDIMIGDIMATAKTEIDGEVTHVGQFSGKGLGGMNAKWSYKSDHHGYMFVTNEIVAKTSYTQGLDPDFRYLDRRQYFDPMLDNVGVTAIEKSEIAMDIGVDFNGLNADEPFGFKPNYGEMKWMSDVVSGDFRCPSINAGLDSWYLSRLIDSDNYQELNFINERLSRALEDGVFNNYDRIFQNSSTDADHFYSVFRFNVHAMRPMKSVTEILEPKEAASGRDLNIDKQI